MEKIRTQSLGITPSSVEESYSANERNKSSSVFERIFGSPSQNFHEGDNPSFINNIKCMPINIFFVQILDSISTISTAMLLRKRILIASSLKYIFNQSTYEYYPICIFSQFVLTYNVNQFVRIHTQSANVEL